MSLPEKFFEPASACPLDGVRVVDMSRLVSGNMVSLQLADFGAEVVKIEDPNKGDPLRAWQTNGVSVHWKVHSRNKKSLALDLRAARGRELLGQLVAGAHILIENFRPGTLEAMGLAPGELQRRNPKLIILRVSGWGQDGPYRDRPGFGTLVESMSGYAARTGFADREPVLPPTALADMVAGLYGAFAAIVALREVEKGGAGQVIDLPLLDPLFSFIGTEAAIYRLTGEVRERTGSRSETTSPRNVFRTKDGRYIGISASIQAMAERLFRAIGRGDMIADPRFRTNTDRVANAADCEAPIAAFIAARSLTENMEIFERAEVTAAPVYDIDQFMADPHVLSREILVDVPDRDIGHLPMHNIIPRLSQTPGRLRRPAPALGEHTDEILSGLGLGRAEIDGLARDRIIRLGAALCATRCRFGAHCSCPGDRAALCRGCGPARRRRDHSRPRRQCRDFRTRSGARAGSVLSAPRSSIRARSRSGRRSSAPAGRRWIMPAGLSPLMTGPWPKGWGRSPSTPE